MGLANFSHKQAFSGIYSLALANLGMSRGFFRVRFQSAMLVVINPRTHPMFVFSDAWMNLFPVEETMVNYYCEL